MVFRFDDFELNPDTRELIRGGDQMGIEPQVFDVLLVLVQNRDRVVSKTELLDAVWGDRFVSESALSSRIKFARRAVGDDGRTQRLIKNVHGRGYRFVGEVLEGPAGDTSVPARLDLSVDQEFPFVGRLELLAVADALGERASRGDTTALLVGGEPGIGKTRLATEIADRSRVRHGCLVLGGRCDRHLSTSLQPWARGSGASGSRTSPTKLFEPTSPGSPIICGSPCRRSTPRLGVDRPPPPAPTDDYATIDAIAVLLERISQRRPVTVVLDDVQWAGGATRALASLLIRRGTSRVLLILTYRTTVDDLEDPVREWLADLESHPGVELVELDGLARADIESLVGKALTAEQAGAVGEEVWTRSGGHSLFATELIRDVRSGVGADHLPRTVASLVNTRLERLPADVSGLVGAAAAVGLEFDLGVAAAAADLEVAAALDAVDIALRAQIVHEVAGTTDRFRFSHLLMPAAVLESMTSARRVRLHARIVDVLSERDGSRVEIAHHLLEASPILDPDRVVSEVRETATVAMIDHQYDRAAALLARCADIPEDDRVRAEVLTELGHAYNQAGRQPKALEPFDRAATAARRHGWTDLLVSAALGRWGQSSFRASQDRTVVPLIDEALGFESELDPVTAARLVAKRAIYGMFTSPLAERDRSSARALDLVGEAPTPERLEVLEARWMAIACPAMVDEVASMEGELAMLRKQLGALTTDACAPEMVLYWQGLGSELRDLYAEIEADPRQKRDVDQWRSTALAGTLSLFEGDLAAARLAADEALQLGREPWGEAGRVVHGLVHLLIDVLNGTAEGSLDRWERIAEEVPSDSMRATRAWAEAMWGDPAVARELLDAVAPNADQLAENYMGGFGLVGCAEAVLRLGAAEHVDHLRATLMGLTPRMLGHPWAPSLAVADVLCRLGLMQGDEAEAARHRAEALETYTRIGADSLARRLARATA